MLGSPGDSHREKNVNRVLGHGSVQKIRNRDVKISLDGELLEMWKPAGKGRHGWCLNCLKAVL